jgi:hypothetical protein
LLEDRTLLDVAHWINPAGGDWNTPSNWSINGLPGANDDVFIDVPGDVVITHSGSSTTTIRSLTSQDAVRLIGGTLSIAAASSVNNFELAAGTLTGPGDLAINGAFSWTSGTLSGSGATVIAAGARLDIVGTGTHTIAGGPIDSTAGPVNWLAGRLTGTFNSVGTLNIADDQNKEPADLTVNKQGGLTVWSGNGDIGLNGSVTFNNQVGAVFEARNDRAFANSSTSGTPVRVFNNAGTFRKAAGSGSTTVGNMAFNNTGTVEVLSGRLDVAAGGSSSGAFAVAAGASLRFTGGTYTLQNGAAFSGAGPTRVAGATLTLAADISMPANVALDSGTLTGSGIQTVTGLFEWTGGTLAGSGATVIAAGARLDIVGTGTHTISGRPIDSTAGPVNWLAGMLTGTFNNVGTLNIAGDEDKNPANVTINKLGGLTVWSGNGRISVGAPATFNNPAGAVFEAQNDRAFTLGTSSAGSSWVFNNAGTFRKASGSGSTIIGGSGMAFNNTGTVEVLSGRLDLESGGSSGAFAVAAGTSLRFTGGTYTWQSGITFSGMGDVRIQNGSRVEVNDAVTVAVPIIVAGGTLAGGRIVAQTLTVISGAVTALPATAATTATLEIDVSGTLTVASGAGGRIDVTGLGYLAGRTTGNTAIGAASGRSAASHGGQGTSLAGFTNLVYGDFAYPADWGAGGVNAPGGGATRITAHNFVLNGELLANGGGSSADGAGAGGSIYVVADTLSGTGIIRAAGGSSANEGGGGGRIAVYAKNLAVFNVNSITSPGGIPGGSPGTVHVRQGVPLTRVRSHAPAGVNGGYVAPGFNSVTLTFSRAIVPASLEPGDFQIVGPTGPIAVQNVTQVSDRIYRAAFPAQAVAGNYRFYLSPAIVDSDGLALDQNANGVPGETEDGYSFTLIVDTVAPRIVAHSPPGDVAGTMSSLDVIFSEAIDKTTLTTSDITIARPGSPSIAVNGITEVGFNRFRITFAAQTLVGAYDVKIGPDVRDKAGNKLDQDRDGVLGETTDDVYDAQFNLVPVDIGLSNLVVGASQLWAGEQVLVSWSGINRSGAALLGKWIDAVYLSTDDEWDIDDVRLATVEHIGGLAADSTYAASATINVPGKISGSYHILVRADVANQERETNEADNFIVSALFPLDVRPLVANGSAVNGTLTTADRGDFYKIVLASGDSLKLKLHSSTAGSQTELYVSYAGLPSRVAFNQRSAFPGADPEISLKAINGGGVYYVLVYGSQVPGSTPYTISAERAAFFVSNLSPNRIGMASPAQLTLTGTGFDETTVVEFIKSSGSSARIPSKLVSETKMIVTIDFVEVHAPFTWTAGSYSVKVTNGATSVTLPNAFEALTGGSAKLETNLVVPGEVSPAFPIKQTLWVEYRNTGSIAMAAPLLQVSADANSLLTTDETLANTVQTLRTIPNSLGGSVQLFGVGASATPGLLQPGEGGRLPVYYVGLSKDERQEKVSFSLGSLTAQDTTEKVAYLSGPTERVVFERPATGKREFNPKLPIEPMRVVRSNATSNRVIVDVGTSGGGGGGGSGIGLSPPNVFEEYLMID